MTASDLKRKKESNIPSNVDVKYVGIASKLMGFAPKYCSCDTSKIYLFSDRDVRTWTRRADNVSRKESPYSRIICCSTVFWRCDCEHGKLLQDVFQKPNKVCKGDGVCATGQCMVDPSAINSLRMQVGQNCHLSWKTFSSQDPSGTIWWAQYKGEVLQKFILRASVSAS